MQSTQPKTILLADAQFLVRAGLRCILAEQTEVQIVGEAATEEELFQQLQALRPDMLIIDYNSPKRFSREVIALVSGLYPTLRILAISDDSDKNSILRVLDHGVLSFLTKSCGEQEVSDAVRATVRGDKFFWSKILDVLLEKSLGRTTATCAPSPLSAREIEVVQLVVKGYIARQIADMLHLSPHTVYTHRKNIMKKLQLQSPAELTLYALQNGIIETT